MDVVRQMYPWKSLIIDQLKNWQWPLWNPYNFSGTPLLANLQSSVFFPGNFVFFLLPKLWAWVTLVVSLPLLFTFFCFLFLRSLKLKSPSSIFGAVVLGGISYLSVWAEQIVVIQSVIFLPLALWSLNKFLSSRNKFFLLVIPLLMAFSIFGGHIQSAVYSFIIFGAYALYKKVSVKVLAVIFYLAIALNAVQLAPSLELYFNSVRGGSTQQKIIADTALPFQNLVTVIAPDYFGNPANGNLKTNNYDNSLAYFGLVAFIFSLYGLKHWRANPDVKFFGLLGIGGLLFSLPPLANIFPFLHIPILGSSYLSRATFIFEFCLGIVSAFGFEQLLIKKHKPDFHFFTPIIGVIAILVLLYVTIYIYPPAKNLSKNYLMLP